MVQRANRDYLYWDRLKHLPMPEGFTAEDIWFLLKVVRRSSGKATPVTDVHGHSFWYSLTDEVQRCLMVIDQQTGRRVGSSASGMTPDVQRRYLLSRRMDEAIASSQIEGAATTRRVAKEMLRTGRSPQTRSERMILNNFQTVSRIRDLGGRPLTPAVLLELQASLTEDTLDDPGEVGRFRTSIHDDNIVVADGFGGVAHVPPPSEEVEGQLERLCDFANDDGEPFIHPVVKAVILHFWLAYLHPFCNGNGRTARALFYLHVLRRDYWLFEYVSISRVILRRRAQYERAFLYSESDDADLTYFLTFNLHCVEAALEEFWAYAEHKAEDDRRLQQTPALDADLNQRQRAILGRALTDVAGRFTIRSHQTSHSIAYGTARSDLLDLAKRGYLQQRKQGRAFVFVPAPDLRERLLG